MALDGSLGGEAGLVTGRSSSKEEKPDNSQQVGPVSCASGFS